MSPPRLAVVTVTHNSGDVLGDWVDAFESGGLRHVLELCVVDSGSSPEEREAARALVEHRVDAFVPVPNLGFGRATNIGVTHTSAPVLLILNPDAQIERLPLELLDPEFLAGAIVAPELRPIRTPISTAAFSRTPNAWLESLSLVLGHHAPSYERTYDSPGYLSGGSLLLTRADFVARGGFSSQFFLYSEDADLCLRHRAAGGELRVERRWVVQHTGMASTNSLWRPDALDGLSRWSARRLALRHEGRSRALALHALMAMVYVPRRALAEARNGPRRVLSVVLDLLLPGRILRRLQAVPPDPVTPPDQERSFYDRIGDAPRSRGRRSTGTARTSDTSA